MDARAFATYLQGEPKPAPLGPLETIMPERLTRYAVVFLLLALGAYVAEPYLERFVFRTEQARPVSARGDLADFEKTTVSVFEQVSPSVLQVVAVPRGRRLGAQGAVAQGTPSGTGFLWDAAGHVVTNNHVVDGAGTLIVRMASGDTVQAELVGRAPTYDLAVLRLPRSSRLPPPVQIGSSANLKVGQSAFAIGNPFGLDQSLTTGIISALRRRLPTSGGREVADVIQTDAAINPGNSGGPLLDSAGRLIGVNTAIYSPSGVSAGIGFAIPVDLVNRIVPELIRSGRVPTPGIGVIAADEALAAQLGVPGVMIAEIVPGSPAARAGLRGINPSSGTIGDIIVEAKGETVRHLSDFTDRLEELGVGQQIRLKVLRGDATVPVTVAIADVGS